MMNIGSRGMLTFLIVMSCVTLVGMMGVTLSEWIDEQRKELTLLLLGGICIISWSCLCVLGGIEILEWWLG